MIEEWKNAKATYTILGVLDEVKQTLILSFSNKTSHHILTCFFNLTHIPNLNIFLSNARFRKTSDSITPLEQIIHLHLLSSPFGCLTLLTPSSLIWCLPERTHPQSSLPAQRSVVVIVIMTTTTLSKQTIQPKRRTFLHHYLKFKPEESAQIEICFFCGVGSRAPKANIWTK